MAAIIQKEVSLMESICIDTKQIRDSTYNLCIYIRQAQTPLNDTTFEDE